MKSILPVLQVNPSDLASRALVVGDPRRAEIAAAMLESPRQVGANRAYVTYTGYYAGQKITVCSHGVGAASASVCFTELLQGGVQTFLRAGTCGALQPDIEDGSLIIGVAAVREDGTSDQLVPLAYPAYADARLTLALQMAAHSQKVTWRQGVIVTQAHLYPGLLPSTIGIWQQAKAAAVEMEYAALLVIASLNGACAGGIFVTDGNLARQSASLSPENYQPIRPVVENSIQMMLRVALEAFAIRSSLSGALP